MSARTLIAAALLAAGLLTSAARERAITVSGPALDAGDYAAPAMGNGHIGFIPHSSGLGIGRLLCGTAYTDGTAAEVSHIQPAVSPINLCMSGLKADDVAGQTLDMTRAAFTTRYRTPAFEAECTLRALRSIPGAVMASVSIKALTDTEITVSNSPIFPPSLADTAVTSLKIHTAVGDIFLARATAAYNHGRDVMVSSAIMLPGERCLQSGASELKARLAEGETARFDIVAALCCSADFRDPFNEADRQAIYASRLGATELIARHEAAWRALWSSDIIIEGDPELQEQVTAALYNIYSSIRAGSRRSIPPMGLTSGKYYGHIFWDADTWMLPVLAVLHPELSQAMTDYRFDRLPAARRRAAAHGYRGAMFPWESDNNGEESTPTFALTGPLEHHVTADVARGAWLNYCVTADTARLRAEGWPLLRDCADFWVSRASENPDGTFSIRNVVGADEYAIGVDDNAFTNAAAIRALQYAAQAADILGLPADSAWCRVAAGLRFHYFPGGKVMRVYHGYRGVMTKQADVELLGYPLGLLDDEAVRANIDYYSTRIDSINGPAMSHSAMAVNYARTADGARAARLVDRSFRPNLRGPFYCLSETPGNNSTYFMTAAGGLLQAIIFGYAGIDITPEGLTQIPSALPASIRSLTVTTPTRTFRRENFITPQ